MLRIAALRSDSLAQGRRQIGAFPDLAIEALVAETKEGEPFGFLPDPIGGLRKALQQIRLAALSWGRSSFPRWPEALSLACGPCHDAAMTAE
jgi:hypothetical protein